MKKIKPHLTFDQRIEIQQMLSHGIGYRTIGKRIGKHETTVSREVKKHLIVTKTEVVRTDANGKIVNSPCPKLLKPPFTCNGCPKHRYKCGFDKFVYYAKQAQQAYESTLVTAREGIPLNSQKFYDNDRILKEGLEAGRHLHQIMQAHDLGVSKTTVYRHRQKGYLSVSNIEFPRLAA
jgi:IS30 family transposase